LGGNLETLKIEPKKDVESSGWLMDNLAHPFVNAAVIDPINAVASVGEAASGKHLPRIDLLSVPESTGTASWLAQTLSGGVGAIAPYVIAGKLTGGALESGGRFLESKNLISTGGVSAKFLASERTGMIVGAGLYGGARDPQGHETRFGNAVGSMVGFGAFEYGNSLTKGLSLSRSVPLRALVGAVGGTGQLMTSNLISEGNFGSTDNLMKAASSGAALNLFLPAAQHQLGKAIDATNIKMGRPIPVDHFVARENWTDNSPLQSIIDRSPLTRVQRAATGDASLNQNDNVVTLGPNDGPAKLGHEVNHRITGKQAESSYKEAADLLKTDPDAAKQKFIDIRTAQEKAAIEAESRVQAAADMKSPYKDTNPDLIKQLRATNDQTYGDLFKQEADQFEKSGGKFRPSKDFSGSYRKGDNGLHLFVYDKETEFPGTKGFPATKEQVAAYETNNDSSFQRWTKMDAVNDENGKTWGTIEIFAEPVETPYGMANRVDSFPDKSIAYHITESDVVANNTVVRVYTKGTPTEYGIVTSTVTHPDGQVDYGKLDGTSATKYAIPKEEFYGKVIAEDTKSDGTTFYHLTDGGTVEYYSTPLKVQMAMPDGSVREVQVETAWRSNGKASRSMMDRVLERGTEPPDSEPVANSAPIRSEYLLTDQTSMEQVFHPDRIEIIERPVNGEINTFSPKFMVEEFASPIQTPEGSVNRMVRSFDSSVYHINDGADTRVQVYDANHSRPTEYGDATRVLYLKNDMVQYTLANGNKVLTHPSGIDTEYGVAKGIETAPDKTEYYHRQNGGVVEKYPEPVTTNVGTIDAIEKTPNGVILYRPQGANDFHSVEIDYTNKRMTYSDDNGDMIANGYKPLLNDFMLMRKFNPKQYPDGKVMPQGKVRSIETDANGVSTYRLVDGTAVTDAK
jgi:hypothetical protein